MLNGHPTIDVARPECITETYRHVPPEDKSEHHTPSNSFPLRTIPSLEHLCLDKPLPPIVDMDRPHPHHPYTQRKLNMSLFSLFSRPKVQTLRGYVEPGLPSITPLGSGTESYFAVPADNHSVRCASALSVRMTAVDPPSRRPGVRSTTQQQTPVRDASSSDSHERSPCRQSAEWESPPFFQASSQAIKHGIAEAPSNTEPATVLKRSKAARRVLRSSVDNAVRLSLDADLSKTTRAGTGGLHRKVFLLVPAGYILQYAEHGPSERLPERVLQLGESSAAFASDLIPGRHFVVQISQSMDGDGHTTFPAPTGSLFSRMTSRAPINKQVVSQMLLVLPDAVDMAEWIRVLRACIRSRHESPSRQGSCSEVRSKPVDSRNGSKSDSIDDIRHFARRGVEIESQVRARSTSPIPPEKNVSSDKQYDGSVRLCHDRTAHSPTVEQVRARKRRVSEPPMRAHSAQPTPLTTGPLDWERLEAEAFAAKLALHSSQTCSQATHARRASDTSFASSVAPSTGRKNLGSLRSSVRISTTSCTTAKTSRTNSMTSEIHPHRKSTESVSGYRSLSSYRRSGLTTPATPILYLQTAPTDPREMSPAPGYSPIESPVIGRSKSPKPGVCKSVDAATQSTHANQSIPTLACRRERQASKLKISPVNEEMRPQSFVGELPSPFHWSKTHSTAKRIVSSTALRNSSVQSRTSTFRLPLKVNPTLAQQHAGAASTSEAKSAPPSVHTPEAHAHGLASPSAPPVPQRNPSRIRRVSLFPGVQPEQHISIRPSSRTASASTPRLTHPSQALPPPIRGLKPSRSTASLAPPSPKPQSYASIASRSASPSPRSMSATIENVPLRASKSSPSSTTPPRPMTALPELDLGLPIAALGPPAPPPLAPLPRLPAKSRPGSPMASRPGSPMASRPGSPMDRRFMGDLRSESVTSRRGLAARREGSMPGSPLTVGWGLEIRAL